MLCVQVEQAGVLRAGELDGCVHEIADEDRAAAGFEPCHRRTRRVAGRQLEAQRVVDAVFTVPGLQLSRFGNGVMLSAKTSRIPSRWLVANAVFWGRITPPFLPAPKPRVNMPKESDLPPLRCPILPLFRGCSPPSGTERVRPPKDTSLLEALR